MMPFTDDERTWVGENWLARNAHDSYELYGAIVISRAVFSGLTQDLVTTNSRYSALTYRLCDTEPAATAWLGQLP